MNCPACGYQIDDLVDRPYPGAHRFGLPMRILDALEAEGGWMTAHELADRLTSNPLSIRRACHRLKHRGFVDSRPIHGAWGGEREWRLREGVYG